MSDKSLVLYYSQSGNTKNFAELIKRVSDSDICQIEPWYAYPKNEAEFYKQVHEERANHINPPYKPVDLVMDEYDVVYVGTPNWGGGVALPLATFLKNQKWEGKTILPFLSHAGAGKEDIEKDLKELCPKAKIQPAYSFYGKIESEEAEDVIQWMYTYAK